MKKLLAVAVILALVLAGCGDGTDNEKGGTTAATTLQIKNESTIVIDQVVFRNIYFFKENADIIGTWVGDSLRLDIVDNGWTGSITDGTTGQGQWTRNGNAFIFNNKGGDLTNGTGTLSGDTLTANFKTWRGSYYSFTLTSNNIDKSIKSGTSATKNVEAGSGYIFFNTSSGDYRTNELVVVEENNKAVFTFTNNTLVVDVNNLGISVALGSL